MIFMGSLRLRQLGGAGAVRIHLGRRAPVADRVGVERLDPRAGAQTALAHGHDVIPGEDALEHLHVGLVVQAGADLGLAHRVRLGDEDGELTIYAAGREEKELATIDFNSSIYSTPTIANGVIFVTDRSRLYAIKAF